MIMTLDTDDKYFKFTHIKRVGFSNYIFAVFCLCGRL